jgi:methyl-accepting chemotaxis protein
MFVSIKTKIILPAIILVALAATVAAMNTYLSAVASLKQEIVKTTHMTSRALAENLELWLNGFSGELTNLSAQPSTQKALGQGFLAASGRKNASQIYATVTDNQQAYIFIGLADISGEFVSHSGANDQFGHLVANKLFRSALSSNTLLTAREKDQPSQMLFFLPVQVENATAGVLIAVIDMKVFAERYFNTDGLGRNVIVSLINKDYQSLISNVDKQLSSEMSSIKGTQDPGQLIQINNSNYVYGVNFNPSGELGAFVGIDEEEVFAGIRAARNTAFLMVLVLIILSAAILHVIIRSIVRPISIVESMFKELSSGRGDLTKKLKVESNDEISLLAKHFNTFMETLRVLVSSCQSSCHAITESRKKLVKESEASLKINNQQLDKTELVASAATELSASSQEVVSTSETGLNSVTEIANKISQGLQTIDQQVSQVHALSNYLNTGRDQTDKLIAVIGNIGQVTDIINTIAEQTNLLALNAAIEAARAGDQGRGFAVVADEVRSLAQKTQHSVSEIHATVTDIKNQANDVQSNFSSSLSKANDTVELTDKAKRVFDEIKSQLTEIQRSNTQILEAANQQFSVAENLNVQIVDIASLSNEATQSVAKTREEVEQQNQAIDALNQQIKQFKL